jgi:hypothetical protein
MNWKGNSFGLAKVLLQNLFGGTGESHVGPETLQTVSRPEIRKDHLPNRPIADSFRSDYEIEPTDQMRILGWGETESTWYVGH